MAGVVCLAMGGCDLAVRRLPNDYRIVEMNVREFRMVDPSRSVLMSNIRSYGVVQGRYVVGECTRAYLDAPSEPEAKNGWYILDTQTGDYHHGPTAAEYGQKLRAMGLVPPSLKVLLR